MTTLHEAQLNSTGRSASKSYLVPPLNRWPVALNFEHIRPGPGVILIILPRGQVAVWEGNAWRRVSLSDWRKTYLQPLSPRLAPFTVVQFPQLTECYGNARTVQYPVTEGLVTQLLTGPWHPSLARILTWVLES